MALSIAMSSVWDGAAEVVKGMVDPVAFQAMVYTSLATCMALLLVPEPITKALMVAITVGVCTYLGWSTVWGILQGWRWLQAEAGAARTFGELSAAGERFGKLLGANTTRVMVMVAAMALGSTAGMAVGGPGAGLPAWGQAAQLAAAEGLAPALAVPVASVMAVGETLTAGMAVGSNVVMAANPAKSSTPAGPRQLAPPVTVKHHIFNKFRGASPSSQKYRDFFRRRGIDVDRYTVEIPEKMHQEFIHRAEGNWTTRWKEWIDAHPNATATEVYQFAGQMMDEYGLSGLPLVPYR